jgi:hypothetical protein
VLRVRTKSVRPPEAFVFAFREFVYQYNGKASLQDEPELVGDTVSIPAPDTLVRRHDSNFGIGDECARDLSALYY